MANYSSSAMVDIDTHSNPLSSDLDHELLYALAWMKSRQGIEQFARVEDSKISGFLTYLSIAMGWLEFGKEDVLLLIAHFQRGENYRSKNREWRIEEGILHVWELLENGEKVDRRLDFALARETVIEELEALLALYEEVKAQGVSIEKGLLPFFGNSPDAEHIVSEVLARTQYITSSDVAKCWWLIVQGIKFEWVKLGELERFITTGQEPMAVFGTQMFWMRIYSLEIPDGGDVEIFFGAYACSCRLVDLIAEIQKLIQRFYACMEC